MNFKDYYATLGLSRDASADEIQKAYRKLARKYHPDVNRGADSEDRFKEITESYEVLKDPEKRKIYDRFGKNWKQYERGGAPPPGWENVRFDFGGAGGGASGYSSFFDMLFGGAGGGSPFGGPFGGGAGFGGGQGRGMGFESRGKDQEAPLRLSLEEAAQGGQRRITLTDPMTGEAKTVSVTLPRGVRPGQKIRLSGRGGQGFSGGRAGDLYLKVALEPDSRFRLEGQNLHTELPVSPWEAALGADAAVKTLSGEVKVRVPPGSSSGRKIRLRGRGFPNPKGPQGDLYAEIKVVVPTELSGRERQLFEELAEVSSFKAR